MVYHFGLNYGQQNISPGAASLIIATIPILILILAAIFLKEKIPNFDLYQRNDRRKGIDIAQKLTIRRIVLVLISESCHGKKHAEHRLINHQKLF